MILSPAKRLSGSITVPGDKSISHRSIMLGSLANGKTEITGFLKSADCLSTMNAFRAMGIDIVEEPNRIIVNGKGLHGLTAANRTMDMGNSGTTTRLLTGILAGQKFASKVSGDESLNSRPMKRIIEPLNKMGADVRSVNDDGCAPLVILPSRLDGITYNSPVASAQVKSSILLAGMYAEGETTVIEPVLSRNHTELMVNGFGGKIVSEGTKATITPGLELTGQKIEVPGDISSAAYFIAAGLITPNSEIVIKNVGINPTRDGILKVALAMGGNITKENERTVSGEPVCDLVVKSSLLHGITVEGDIIPTLIDEIPIIAVMAACAEGTTIIKDAAELKVKESNRIDTVVEGLYKMDVDVTPTDDGMIINGGKPLHGAKISSHSDHRIAMSFAIASLVANSDTEISWAECVSISYPTFFSTLESIKE